MRRGDVKVEVNVREVERMMKFESERKKRVKKRK
jgi:hypothetical protein